jgi:ATPase subunit of ABC transporter with duplicated ATPase domains
MSIVVNSLTYIHPDGKVLFDTINFSVSTGDKVSLVGNNGVGKSTLLQIIAGRLKQTGGEVISAEKPYYIPQILRQFDDLSILEALQVAEKIKVLHAILAGDVSQQNLDNLNDDWDIEERINSALQYFGIDKLNPSHKMSSLSGGEKTKVLLAGIQIHSPDIVLLDEPSNHLDYESRTILYEFIEKSKSTILIVSHDRELLGLVNKTMELTPSSIEIYGGNYDFYNQQKQIKMDALQAQLADKEKTIKQTQQRSREIAEQRQKQESRGKTQKAKAGIPRIAMGRLKDISERSSAKMNNEQHEKINNISSEINSIKRKIQEELILRINITNPTLHKGKRLVEAKEINIIYDDRKLWKEPLSFQIYSGDRVQITGNNGTGKTSLIRLITNKISVAVGDLFLADFNALYIDQEYSVIENKLSVIEHMQKFNDRSLPEHDLKMLLHYHQFDRDYWDRECANLSGGEKMKLLLCCLSTSSNAPDLLILDEPTNNLDIHSQDILTNAIAEFKGTIIVVSHDTRFVEKIGLEKYINL